MALSLGVRGPAPISDPRMVDARARVFAATRRNKVLFLNPMNRSNVIALITEGIMIGAADQETAEIGRRYTKRRMPW